LAVAELIVGSIVLPRTESPNAISRLTEFEWFHKIETENETVTPEIDDLLLRAQKTYQSIEEVVKGLKIPPRVGIMEILFKGTMFKKKNYELNEIENMINDLEKRTPDVISKASKILEEEAETKRSLETYTALKETLQIASKLNINLSNFGLMRYFYTNLFVINSSDYGEIARTLDEIPIYKYELKSKDKSAIIIICSTKDSDKVLKIMRALNSNPFTIPQGFPQIPSEAFSLAESKIKRRVERHPTPHHPIPPHQKRTRLRIAALCTSLCA
jgi:V/A-type H+-transporting ATPase subunit I